MESAEQVLRTQIECVLILLAAERPQPDSGCGRCQQRPLARQDDARRRIENHSRRPVFGIKIEQSVE
jgi:hypothetical protein